MSRLVVVEQGILRLLLRGVVEVVEILAVVLAVVVPVLVGLVPGLAVLDQTAHPPALVAPEALGLAPEAQGQVAAAVAQALGLAVLAEPPRHRAPTVMDR